MPVESNLSQAPYFDEHDPSKNYHRILFRPSVSVQTRELNELQSILQEQIERFGDAVYKRGTVIQGCAYTFYNKYPYVKILDNETDGNNAIVSLYNNLFTKSTANLRAYIVNYVEGFEASDPDLKTLYLNYINAGDDGLTNAYSPSDILTIYDSNNSLYAVTVDDGSLGFSNTDTVIITPAIAVNVSTGTWSNGDNLTIPASGANLDIIQVDELTLADSNQVLLYCRPRTSDLANGEANSDIWTLIQDADCVDPGNTVTCTIENIYGSGASANVQTLSSGKVANVNMISKGSDYLYAPQVDVWSPNNSTGIASLVLTSRNFFGKVQIATGPTAIGNGYAFKVSDGIIYQKGSFLRSEEQTVIVSKYTTTPNAVSAGFVTEESFIDSNIDTELLDNSLNTRNETAPGADRLQLIPTLTTISANDANANDDFYTLVEWNEGRPYKQNQFTDFSGLGDELARRTFDASGNFVVDTFQVTTLSPSNTQNDAKYYTAAVDPGQAYISGRKVQTRRNYHIDVTKGIDTIIANNSISLNYGNYTRIKEVSGMWLYSTGDVVDLHDVARGFLSNGAIWEVGTIAAPGNKIGEARIRSLKLENGPPGEPNTVYRLFLFDIRMNPGKAFDQIRSIYYNGASYDGIADTVLDTDPTTQNPIATLEGKNRNRLVFKAGCESLKNSNGTNYIYRTIDQSLEMANTGLLVKSVASDPDEFFPYGTSSYLSDNQMEDLYVVPTQNTMVAYINATGTVTCLTTSAVVNGVGTSTNFFGELDVGDYVQVYESGVNNDVRRVVSISSSNSLTLDANLTFANSTGAALYRAFPKNVPIPFGYRGGLTANVDAGRNTLTLDLGLTLAGTSNLDCAVGMNIQREDVSSTAKSVQRDRFIKIRIANNTGGIAGPWCVGVPDVVRLTAVYTHTDSTVNVNSTDVTSEFYIDSNQTVNYNGLSYLYIYPPTRYTVDSGDYLLVKFDYCTRASAGYFDTTSYLNTSDAAQIYTLDSTPVESLTTSAISWEVPEIYTEKDEYYDMLNCFDFRPDVANTADPQVSAGSAPLNPPETIGFGDTADPLNDAKFPDPDAVMTTQMEQYQGRVDHINMAGRDGTVFVTKGQPHVDPRFRYEPNHSKDSLKLQVISVPAYPAIVRFPSDQMSAQLSTGVFNEKEGNIRTKTRIVKQLLSSTEMQLSQPMVYTMEDIGNLERRVRDLEYYASLSVLETSITNKIIPSSVDRTLNRFKFGFLADDFETDLYTDLDNPQYAASKEIEGDYSFGLFKSPIEPNQANTNTEPLTKATFSNVKITKKETYRIVPPRYPWMHKHFVDNFDYVHRPVLQQPYATIPLNDKCTIGIKKDTGSRAFYTVVTGHPVTRTDYITFGIESGTAALYFYNYGGGDSIDIYQANTLIASTNNTSSAIQNLTAADKVWLSTNNIAKTWYTTDSDGGLPDLEKDYVREGATDYVKYVGKLVWTHDPAAVGSAASRRTSQYSKKVGETQGLAVNYKIVVKKSNQSLFWRYLLSYPDAAGINNTVVDPCSPPSPTGYNGNMDVDVNSQWSCSKQFKMELGGLIYDVIQVKMDGLKPNTFHNFYLDGVLDNEDVIPWGRRRGDPLITNKYGKLTFNFVIDETWISKIRNDNGKYNFWGAYTAAKGGATKATFGSTGYTLFEVRGVNSSGKTLVANRAPQKFLN